MRNVSFSLTTGVIIFLTVSSFAQSLILINQPGDPPPKAELLDGEQQLMKTQVLPTVRKKLAGDACVEEINIAGAVNGSFTRAGSNQTLVFYQFCETGNGLGSAGVFVIDGGKVAANYISADSGWTIDAKALPDINKNGLHEVALYYSGGMHQGQGGTGADIMEFSSDGLRGIGWFQAGGFDENSEWAYRVTVKPGSRLVFFQEKWSATGTPGKYRKAGKAVPLKLEPAFGKFEAIK